MGWIRKRRIDTGNALYEEGPKRKGPLRKIVRLTSTDNSFFGCDSGWLECGHHSDRIYGENRAICIKCAEGKPKDIEDINTGWPK